MLSKYSKKNTGLTDGNFLNKQAKFGAKKFTHFSEIAVLCRDILKPHPVHIPYFKLLITE